MEKNPGPRKDEVCCTGVWGLDRRCHVDRALHPMLLEDPVAQPWMEERGTHLFMLENRGHMPSPRSLLSAGELRTKADVVRAAVAGAGVTALLAGCLCLIYFV